jgi:hypothetical protein
MVPVTVKVWLPDVPVAVKVRGAPAGMVPEALTPSMTVPVLLEGTCHVTEVPVSLTFAVVLIAEGARLPKPILPMTEAVTGPQPTSAGGRAGGGGQPIIVTAANKTR